MANVFNIDKKIIVIGALAEGSSIRAYAWTHETDDPKNPKRSITVLHVPRRCRQKEPFGYLSFRSYAMPMPKPKKMGRPVLPKGHAKSGKIQVRLSPEEEKKIAARAKASKLTVSAWARSILIAAMEA